LEFFSLCDGESTAIAALPAGIKNRILWPQVYFIKIMHKYFKIEVVPYISAIV
jgi:hypothetical protein